MRARGGVWSVEVNTAKCEFQAGFMLRQLHQRTMISALLVAQRHRNANDGAVSSSTDSPTRLRPPLPTCRIGPPVACILDAKGGSVQLLKAPGTPPSAGCFSAPMAPSRQERRRRSALPPNARHRGGRGSRGSRGSCRLCRERKRGPARRLDHAGCRSVGRALRLMHFHTCTSQLEHIL